MSSTMTMESPIRRITGMVDINFFESGSDNSVYIKSSTKSKMVTDSLAKQIFVGDLDFSKRLAFFDGETRLDGEFYLLDKDSNAGWIGDELSNNNKSFDNPQSIEIEFVLPRPLPYIELKGLDSFEYPVDFNISFYIKSDTESAFYTKQVRENKLCDYIFGDKARDYSDKICDSEGYDKISDKAITKVKLDIIRWSKVRVLPRITYFSGEMHEIFTGNKLQSIEVLEEKTGDVDKLSYGISSNYCKVRFLNEKYKFFEEKYYNLLRKNLFVQPFIILGNPENPNLTAPLGKFYSDEWNVPSDSQFISCKAYDILFSLKDLIINYGVNPNKDGAVYPITPYSGQTVGEVIQRLEELINTQRRNNGILGEKIKIEARLDGFENDTLDYTLIEKKSAWEILQDIADLCCAYVYAYREAGKTEDIIIIERDRFDNPKLTSSDVIIDMENAFTYSLPVSSKNVINTVSAEYNELVVDADKDVEDSQKFTIKKEDLTVVKDKDESGKELATGKVLFTIKLDNVYESISDIFSEEPQINDKLTIHEVNFNFITCALTGNIAQIETLFGEKYAIYINKTTGKKIWKFEKRNHIQNDTVSISRHGIKEYNCRLNNLMTKAIAEKNSNKILNRYSGGVSYLVSNWTGSDALKVGYTFKGDEEGEKKERKTFECLSNEISISENFRQATKGIEVK